MTKKLVSVNATLTYITIIIEKCLFVCLLCNVTSLIWHHLEYLLVLHFSQLFQIWNVYFLTATFSSSQPLKHEGKIDRKNYLCHRNAIRFMGSRQTIKIPTSISSLNQPCPQRPRTSELNQLSPTFNSELPQLNLNNCLYNILSPPRLMMIRTRH